MAQVCFDAPFLYFDAASVPQELRLSGPAPVAPPLPGFTDGDEEWRGPYGTPIDQWTDVDHPPGGGLSYTAPVTPNESWLFDSDIPAGWYTVIERKV